MNDSEILSKIVKSVLAINDLDPTFIISNSSVLKILTRLFTYRYVSVPPGSICVVFRNDAKYLLHHGNYQFLKTDDYFVIDIFENPWNNVKIELDKYTILIKAQVNSIDKVINFCYNKSKSELSKFTKYKKSLLPSEWFDVIMTLFAKLNKKDYLINQVVFDLEQEFKSYLIKNYNLESLAFKFVFEIYRVNGVYRNPVLTKKPSYVVNNNMDYCAYVDSSNTCNDLSLNDNTNNYSSHHCDNYPDNSTNNCDQNCSEASNDNCSATTD